MWFYLILALFVALIAICWFLSDRPPAIKIDGSHIIVTGGSSGIGLTLSKELAKRGAHVTIIARNKEKLEAARQIIEDQRVNNDQMILDYSADVSDYQVLKRAIDEAVKRHGKVDALITSAGDTRPERFEDVDISYFTHLMQVNYIGSVYATRAVMPYMLEKKSGRVIFVSSILGVMGYPAYSGYAASKFALRGFAESLHLEYSPYGINFSVSIPANVDTPMYAEEEKYKPPEAKALEAGHKLFGSEEVAMTILNSLLKYRFLIPCGMDVTFVSWLVGGFGPGSFVEVIPQVFLSGILRIVSLYNLWSWKGIVKKNKIY